jgi:TonB family protein
MDPGERERRKNVALALALSAGLHGIAMMTLDLSPGPWRHGVAPAFHVALKNIPLDMGERDQQPISSKAENKEPGIAGRAAQAGSSVPLAPRYYRNNEVDVQAVPVSRGPLVFPELAFLSKLSGTVKARVYIGEDGTVESIQVVSVWPRKGIFEEAALEALRQVRYKPAEIAGQPVKSQKLIEVKFNPYEDRDPAAD